MEWWSFIGGIFCLLRNSSNTLYRLHLESKVLESIWSPLRVHLESNGCPMEVQRANMSLPESMEPLWSPPGVQVANEELIPT